MELNIAVIVIYEEKAYIPVHSKTGNGLFVEIEPVYICNLFIDEMVETLQKARDASYPFSQARNLEERKKNKDPMLIATRTKSWKELARTSNCYTIEWSNNGLSIFMSQLDKQGRWRYNPEKTKILPFETPLKDIVQIVLNDAHSITFSTRII